MNRLRPDPDAVAHLRAADPVLGGVIDAVGGYDRPVDPDLWRALAGSIVSQQLSLKAAATIEGRLCGLAGEDRAFPAPDEVLAFEEERLRGCGLSRAKTSYIRGIAEAVESGRLDLEALQGLPDDEVIERLTELRGVGRWTAEMVLIFGMGRPDVLPVGDLGFRVAVQRAYGAAERPGPKKLAEIATPWRPWATTATLFLWESLKGDPPERDPENSSATA